MAARAARGMDCSIRGFHAAACSHVGSRGRARGGTAAVGAGAGASAAAAVTCAGSVVVVSSKGARRTCWGAGSGEESRHLA